MYKKKAKTRTQSVISALLQSCYGLTLLLPSQLLHVVLFTVKFPHPSSTPPLHIGLVFCGILWAPLECYHIGLVCVCSHRVQRFEVIWTLWWWSKCLICATVPLQLVQDSLQLHVYSNEAQSTQKMLVKAGGRCILRCVYLSLFGLCFIGCMLCAFE